MIIELEINGARVIISGDNLTVNVAEESCSYTSPANGQDNSMEASLPSGAQIKALRKALGLNQSEFAELVGVSQPSTICRWEKGSGHPRGPFAVALVNLLRSRSAA